MHFGRDYDNILYLDDLRDQLEACLPEVRQYYVNYEDGGVSTCTLVDDVLYLHDLRDLRGKVSVWSSCCVAVGQRASNRQRVLINRNDDGKLVSTDA